MMQVIDALYLATQSPVVMAVVAAVQAATATLLIFLAVLERQPICSWTSIFLFLMTFSAVALSLVRTEPDPEILRTLQVMVRVIYIVASVVCLALLGWAWGRMTRWAGKG